MNSLSSHLFRAAALALALPVLGLCAAVSINGVCVDGNCVTPSTVSFGNTQTGSTSNVVTLNTDPFQVSSTFDVTYNGAGSLVHFYPSATYTGAGPSVGGTDTIQIDLLASIFDDSPGTWDGTYTERIPLSVAASTTASGELFVDGQTVGLVGPFGVGSYDVTKSKILTGLTGNTLNYDFQFVFSFRAGTLPGATDSSPVPEPAQIIPAALSLVGFGLVALRRRKK